ncbi:ABC transporter, partial [Candidatus Daviesbacteria bacterium]|nr:ABC transporter [Candidatus Daviesbacteria bacterium]
VEKLCKRVVIINEGKIIYDGSLEKIINKYAPYKMIKVDFKENIDLKKIEEFGRAERYSGNHVEFRVAKDEISKKTAKLLSEFEVADITIEDPAIEEIIRQIFEQ